MTNILNFLIKEPFVNVICAELGIDFEDYRLQRKRYIITGIIAMLFVMIIATVLKKMYLLIIGFALLYVCYRFAYLSIKNKEQKTKIELQNMYPVFVQSFISLLYTNDNLIKVFLILEHYNLHPVINRQLIILINKYQQSPNNADLIFGEFCQIFNTSSASLLHQLMVNINIQGVNDSEIIMIENKIAQDYNQYIDKVLNVEVKKIYQYGYLALLVFLIICLGLLLTTI